MTSANEKKKEIAAVLRADRVVELEREAWGPLDMLILSEEVERRIRPGRGRPTDPSWDVQRLVRFKGETWQALDEISRDLRAQGTSISPGQLAAILIERGVEALKKSA
jgi:hypothetical protein